MPIAVDETQPKLVFYWRAERAEKTLSYSVIRALEKKEGRRSESRKFCTLGKFDMSS